MLTLMSTAQSREELERQRVQLRKEIEETEKQLNNNKVKTKEGLLQWKLISNKVALQDKVVDNINKDLRLLDNNIYSIQRDINRYNKLLDTLKEEYAKSMVYAYKNRGNYDFLNFIFSASSFNDAIKRVAYLKSYRNYQEIQGQNIILCPGRGKRWFDWLKNEFQSKGANIREMDATTHDRNMAVFQGLVHIMSVSMGRTLQKMNLNPAEAISYSTPVFRINVDLVGRLFAQDLGLYEKLIGKNKYVKEVVDLFLSSMNEGRENLLENQDGNRLAFLEDIQSFLGDFCQQGLKESNQFLNLFYTKQRT